MTTKEQAEIYSVGLPLGFFELADVITWCDTIIMEEPLPDLAIIKASLSGSKGRYAVASALSEVEGEFDKRSIFRAIFRFMYELVNEDRKRAAEVAEKLYYMAFEYGAPDDKAESEMTHYYDSIDLAVARVYGDVEQLTDEMLQFLLQYSSPGEDG